MPGMSFEPVADYCEKLHVPYIRIAVPVYDIVFQERQEKNPCALCAKMRRGSLHTALREAGIHKVALGHHYDDAVETFFLSLFYEGRKDLIAGLQGQYPKLKEYTFAAMQRLPLPGWEVEDLRRRPRTE